jgi:hypothetical protein
MAAMLLVSGLAIGAEKAVTSAMVGQWRGNAQIIMTWCQETNLPVSIQIQSDGRVSGKVGDATLANGQLKRNRGWLGRKLQLKTDYIITGKLEGPIVAREKIHRSGVSIPLNFTGTNFVGGVHTSGTHVGGKGRMVLSARSLTLLRTNAP